MKKFYHPLLLVSALFLSLNIAYTQTKQMSLQEALRTASKGNRQLQIRLLETKKAEEGIKEAKSFLLPAVTASGGYTIYGERPVFFLRNENSNPKLNDVKTGGRFAFDATIAANYPLINHSLKSNIRLAGINEMIRKEETKITEEDIALQLSQLYLTVLMYKEQVTVLQQSRQRNERALKDSRSLYLQGKNLKTDTLSNYISVQNLKASISALESNIVVLSGQMKKLMGMEDSVTLEFTDSLSTYIQTNNIAVSSSGLTIAVDNRKDMKIQSLLIDQSKEQLQNSKAAFKPQLWATAQYQVQSQSDNVNFLGNGLPRTSFAGVRVNIPVFTGNRQKYKAAQSEYYIRQNEIALSDLKSSIQTELAALNANRQDAYNQYSIQQQNVSAAQINYTMMNDRYRYGLGNRLELTDAELALTKAKLDHLQAVYSIRLIELQIKKAMGILQLN
jgi:outer membrane protein